jgi:uncharacterized membrane protein YkoI
MVERKSAAKLGALVLAMVLAVALSGCQKRIKGTIPVKGQQEVAFAQMAKISLPDAVNIVLHNYPGKAIKAELMNWDDYLVYKVEIVTTENTVMDFTVDAGSGNILNTAPEKVKKH